MPLPPHHPTPRGNNLHPRGRKNTASLNYLGPSRRTGVLRLPELLWGGYLKGGDPRGVDMSAQYDEQQQPGMYP